MNIAHPHSSFLVKAAFEEGKVRLDSVIRNELVIWVLYEYLYRKFEPVIQYIQL